MSRLIQDLQELKALLISGIISKEYYFREIDEMLKYANNRDEIALINSYKNLDN